MIPNHPGIEGTYIIMFWQGYEWFEKASKLFWPPPLWLCTTPPFPRVKNHQFREPTSPSLPSFLPCIQQTHFKSFDMPGIVLRTLGWQQWAHRQKSLPSLRIHAFAGEKNNIIKKAKSMVCWVMISAKEKNRAGKGNGECWRGWGWHFPEGGQEVLN